VYGCAAFKRAATECRPKASKPPLLNQRTCISVGSPGKAFRPNTALKESVGLYGVFSQGNIRVFQKPGVQPVTPEWVAVGVGVFVGVGV